MDYTIIYDSSCDLTPELQKRTGAISVPMLITLGDQTFLDDDDLDIEEYYKILKENKDSMTSGAANPYSYLQAYQQAETEYIYVVTISSKLSSSYSNAVIATEMMDTSQKIHVFDSKSASAGGALIVEKLHSILAEGLSHQEVIEQMNTFIDNMKTYFTLEDLSVFSKSGRLAKVVGKAMTILNIQPILGSDGNGEIVYYSQARGYNKIIEKLISLIDDSERKTEDGKLVIAHCNNEPIAARLKKAVEENFNFEEIITITTRGLASLYAQDKGIIIAF